MRIFFDSSAFAKRYIEEIGSEKVLDFFSEAGETIVSVICPIEILSGLNRLRREKKITGLQYHKLKSAVAMDIKKATVLDIAPSVVQQAIRCLETCVIRSLDAIHLGTALEASCDLFVTADRRQYNAGRRIGLKVVFIEKK